MLFALKLGSSLSASWLTILVCLAILSPGAIARASASSGPLPLKVRFWSDEIELTGAVPDKMTADTLRSAVSRAQPGKGIWDRLVIDPSRSAINLPRANDLAGLLFELSLSTRDGSLLVTSDRIVASGLTDSLVAHAAFEARLRTLGARYGGRNCLNQICIVSSDDLKLPLPTRPRPSLSPKPLIGAPYVLSDIEYGPVPGPLRAMPLAESAAISVAEESPASAAPPRSTKATDYETLEPVVFGANTYLVQVDQFDLIDSAAKRIQKLPESAGKIILRGFPDFAGKYDFNDWLSQARAKAVQRHFSDAGISAERFTIEAPKVVQDGPDLRKVMILIPHPPAETALTLPDTAPPPSQDPLSQAQP